MALFLHRKATAPKAIRVTMATGPAGQRRYERAQLATSKRNTGASAPRAWFELKTSLLSERKRESEREGGGFGPYGLGFIRANYLICFISG